MIERQELHCHSCLNYVQFDIDTEQDGNLVLKCPVCGHEHCRVVKDGQVTDERWGSRNPSTNSIGMTISVSSISVTQTSTFQTYNGAYAAQNSNSVNQVSSASVFLYGSWMNTTRSNSGLVTMTI